MLDLDALRNEPTKPASQPPAFDRRALREQVAALLSLEAEILDEQRSLIEFGLDSIMVIRLQTRLAARGLVVPPLAALLEEPTLAAWWRQLDGAPAAATMDGAERPVRLIHQAEEFGLTPVQQAYWIGRQDDQPLGGVGCHLYAEFDGQGVDAGRLETAMRQLLQRHPMLRARFLPSGKQTVMAQSPWPGLTHYDLSGVEANAVDGQLLAIREQLSHRRLRVEQGEVCDLRLASLPGGRSRLYLNLDLLVADVLSFELFLGDLAAFYCDQGDRLPELHSTFAGYLASQQQRDATAREAAKAYWQERLPTLPSGPALPLARQPEQVTRTRFVRRSFMLDRASLDRLQEQAREAGVTLACVLATAYAEVLARWSSEPRFLLNIPLFDRQELSPDVSRMIADFTNLLLLEVDYSAALPFVEHVRQLQRQLHRDLRQAAYSGVEVLRDLARADGGTARSAPVVFACNLGKAMPPENFRRSLGDLGWSISQTPQVWLDHQTYPLADGLLLNWDSVDALFPDNLLDDMFTSYEGLLRQLCQGGWEQPVELLLPERQRRVREQVNDTATEVPKGLLHEPFLAAAARHPEAPALLWSDGSLNYARLLEAAQVVAGRLLDAGVEPGDRVIVCLPKGPVQIIATLGVLLAGSVYVPLAADVPGGRLSAIRDNAAVRVMLVDAGAQRGDWPCTAIALDLASLLAARPPVLPEIVRGAEELAYIIYTSGSTGQPKGVMIDHRGALNTVLDINRRWQVGADDRIFGLSSLSFDLSVYDIFGTLAAGAALVLPSDQGRLDPGHWLDLLGRTGVSVWNSVPALLEMLVTQVEGQGALPASLRLALLSGDWVPLDLPARARALCPALQLVALGGATEASIWSNWFEVAEVPAHWTSIPYGYPLSNQYYRVLDAQGRDCPEGVKGDLYIGGVGVALGYWGDPEKTAHQFSLDPQTGARLYRTGDLARYWANGTLEFLGRKDFQVKIRGHRIELGEIEAVLGRHSAIRQAVVDVQEPLPGNRQLVAYLTLEDLPPQDDDIRQHLEVDLEAYQCRWWALSRVGDEASASLHENLDLAHYQAFWAEVERLSSLAMVRTLALGGLFREVGERRALDDVLAALGAGDRYTKLIGQWLEALVSEGYLQRDEMECYLSLRGFDVETFERAWAGFDDIEMFGSRAASVVDYIRRSIDGHLDMLRGRLDPLEVYFPGGSTEAAEGIYRFNPLMDYLNCIAARLLREVLATFPAERTLRIMEVGAGTGGTSESLFPVLQGRSVRYAFTDLSDFFFERARQRFAAYDFIDYAHYDINREPGPQGFEPGSQDIVVAVNVLHDARNLSASLRYLRTLLRPGGSLLMIEATRNCRLQMISIGFIEGLSDYDDWRVENNLPFLSLEQWAQELDGSGFDRHVAFPRAGSAEATIAQHVVLAATRQAQWQLRPERLTAYLANALPAYMLPSRFITLERLPLSANGKVDRGQLPKPAQAVEQSAESFAAPRPGLESEVAEIWKHLLKREQVSATADFFAIGGDSLLATRMVAELRQRLGCEASLRQLLQHPQLDAFVASLETPAAQTPTLLRLTSGVGKASLLCLPTADGGIDAYRTLARSLDGRLSVYGLQDPEPNLAAESLDARLERYGAAIADAESHGRERIILLGWSFGAGLAAALAERLEREGRPPLGLVLLDPLSLHCFQREGRDDPYRFFGLTAPSAGEQDSLTNLFEQVTALGRHAGLGDLASFERGVGRMRQGIESLRAFHPRPLATSVVLIQAQANAAWEEPLRDWQALLEAGHVRQRVDVDHWRLLSDAASIERIVEALDTLLENRA